MLIGGDHSAAAGYWSGIAQAHQPRGDIGLVWIDAHMDSHTPFTSPNGYVHGMPLAALLGHGDPGLTGLLSPRAAPGSRLPDRDPRFRAGGSGLLRTLDVRVFYMDEVRSRGLERVLDDALEIVGRAPAGFGVTLDLDGIEPGDAPGQHAFPNGLRSDALASPLAARPPLRGPGNFGVQSFRGQGWTHAGLHAGRGSEPCATAAGAS